MKRIVCDASPLIFLAKLDCLDLIQQVLDGEVFVLRCVADEVMSDNAGPVERMRLAKFLKSVRVVDFEVSGAQAGALSRSDRSTLKWSVANGIDWLLADERLLRRVAMGEGISVIGFLGLLLRAVRQGDMPAVAARSAIDESVSRYGCRVSLRLYQRLLAELASVENK